MKIINKLLIVILLIILMFVSLIFTIYSFGLTGEEFLSLIEQDLYQNYILGIIFLFITIISAVAIYPLLKSKNETSIIQTGKNGDINISLKAIDKIVRTVALEQEGIDIKDIKLDTRQNRLYIELVITVEGDLSIPETSSNVKNSIKERLNETVGTDLAEIKILIDNVDTLSKKNKIEKEKSEVETEEDTDIEDEDNILQDEEIENDKEKVDANEFLDDFDNKE